ncbi:MAG TPA: class I SAM-dependent methyltransferase [Phycisphaerae bacterium]|nr:class I SAM-dependent methyltransferase [Phycisphaerae bacterium]
MSDTMSIYFSGEKLYGDDFTLEQIEQWFSDEQEGYADLGAKDKQNYRYGYHQLNMRHGYSCLGPRRFKHALGLGSAYGAEFIPIADRIGFITILDPSEAFSGTKAINGVPCEYCRPNIDGGMPFQNESFDLITCLGVMHHIPNVSKVMKECFRCVQTSGVMVIREPIVSMGDWRQPRAGLTKRERGIPIRVFRRVIIDSGFTIKREALCNFPAIPKPAARIGVVAYNNYALVWLDDVLSRVFSWNTKYHRTNFIAKLGPSSAFFVLTKR